MNLAALASVICTKINQTDTNDIAACKTFLQRRYEMIWNDQLWKDSLVEYTQTLSLTGYTSSSNWLPSLGILLLPPIIRSVLAVRAATGHYNIQRPEYYYRIDYDSFAKTGVASDFILMSPCVWQFQTAPGSMTIVSDSSDAGASCSVDVLDTDGVGITRRTVTLDTPTQLIGTPGTRIDAFLKPVSNDPMTLSPITVAAADTAAPKRQRIRLVLIPSDDNVAIRVLGKRVCPQFTDDLDEPAISGIENCLLAFGQADMLMRERRYGQAQMIAQEGGLLLDQLKKIEVVQQANSMRLVPESGFGNEYNFNGYVSPLAF